MVRLIAMFLGEGEAPHASGLGQVASDGTLLLIVAADVACTRFWKEHIDAVKRACAPALIAKQELLGYLLNDCIKETLLHPDDALPVGQRGDKGAAKAKTVLKVKAKKDITEACWRAAAANPAALASQPPYDLKLPAVTIGQALGRVVYTRVFTSKPKVRGTHTSSADSSGRRYVAAALLRDGHAA